MVWAALGKGLMGAGRAATTAGRGARMASRMFRRRGGKDAPQMDVPASEQTVDVEASPVNVQPTTPLIPSSLDASSISKASSVGTETLQGTAFKIKTTLVDVDTLLKGSLALDKIREESRQKKGEKKERKNQEKELESAAKKNNRKFKLGRLVPTKAKSIFGNIINFFVTLLLGKVLMGLIDNIGLFAKIAKGIAGVANFIIDWGGKLLNAFVSLVDWGYKIFDGLRNKVGDTFGESGLKAFDRVTSLLKLLFNTAIIAALVAGRSGLGGGGGRGGGLTRVGGARGVKPAAVRRYAQRYGREAAIKRFGKKAVQRYGGKFARSAITNLGRKGISKLLGRQGSRVFLKITKNFVSPVVKRIPIIGSLIDFALNVFLFKEPLGKAAFKAIGAGLGSWILGTLGSVAPGIGTFIGAVVGGFAGDILGGLIYDMVFGKKSPTDLEADEKQNVTKSLVDRPKDLSETAGSGGVSGVISATKNPSVKKEAAKRAKDLRKGFKPVRKSVVKTAKRVGSNVSKFLKKTKLTSSIAKRAANISRRVSTQISKKAIKPALNILKSAKKLISPMVRGIPFLGPLVDFLLNVFVFKEPLGRSAFMAIGAGLGAWIGGALGTLIPVPGVGTAIGMFLGGAGGDMLGGVIYDMIFGGKDASKKVVENGDKDIVKGAVESELSKLNKDESKKRVSASFDMDPKVAARRLELEKLKRQFKRGTEERKNIESQIAELKSGGLISSNQKTNDYSGIDTYADYEDSEGDVTYVITERQGSNPTADNMSGISKSLVEGMMLSNPYMTSSGSKWNNKLNKR